ncbi:MAG: hypothetical protein ACXWJJ_04305 [Ramlibacter sp.]
MASPRRPNRILLAALALAGTAAHAADEPAYKFTAGDYLLSGGGLPTDHGLDLNLRRSSAAGNLWVGWYRQPGADISQWRTGWDRTFDAAALRIQPSVQLASGGFRGGSLYFETGQDWFAGAGLGRTNLRPYANLNFDPNDAITLAAGRRWGESQAVTLLLIADNRQNPDQRHLHLNWRSSYAGGERLTLDLLAKRGTVDGQRIARLGFSATYDWPRWFVRAAWDPKVNFTAQDMLRLAAGTRF